jgi:uncharacterized protein YaiE (UPF0345 family)
MKFKSDIEVQAGVKDSAGSSGNAGSILSSTSTGVTWIDNYADWTSVVKHVVKNNGVAVIPKGAPVYVTGSDGTNMLVGLAGNGSEATSSKTMGLVQTQLGTSGTTQTGYVITEGLLQGLNTAGRTAGEPIWLGPNGTLIYGSANKPYAPAHLVFIGIVTKISAGNGEVFVKVQNGFELNEIHDVDIKTNVPVNGDILGFNGTLWVNKTIAGWLGYTPANDAEVVKLTGNQTITGEKTFSAIRTNIAGTLTLNNGISSPIFLTSSSPNILTIGATNAGNTFYSNITFPYSSRNYTFPNASGTLALTSDLHSPVTIGTANGLSLVGQVLSLGLATSTQNGALSSTDWTTFNNKQNALTNPVTGTGGNTEVAFFNSTGSTITSTPSVKIVGPELQTTLLKVTTFGAGMVYSDSSGSTGTLTGTTNALTYWSNPGTIGSLSTATYPNLTELSYVKGVTSSIQTQLNNKQNQLNGTGFVRMSGTTPSYITGSSDQYVKADGSLSTALNSRVEVNFTATAGQTTFTTTYDVGQIDVFYNGSKLNPSEFTATNGTTVVLAQPATLNAQISIVKYIGSINGVSGTANRVAKFTGITTLGDSSIFDDGTNVIIGASGTSSAKLSIIDTSPSLGGILISNTNTSNFGDALKIDYRGVGKIISCGNPTELFSVSRTGGGYFAGNTGIGTTTFNFTAANRTNLAVNNSVSSIIEWQAGNTTYGYAIASSGSFDVGTVTSIPLTFNTNATERMRIFSSGNVFIGPSPSDAGFRLDVNGTGRFATSLTVGAGGLAGRLSVRGTTNDSSAFAFEAANSSGNSLFLIRNDGNVLIGTTTDFGVRLAVSGNMHVTNSDARIRGGDLSGRLILSNSDTTAYVSINGGSNSSSNAIGIITNSQITFNTGASYNERMRITSDGYVGVGTGSTDVNNGDLIGVLAFRSNDASVNSSGAIGSIRSYATASFNTGNVSGDLRFYTQDTGTPNGSLLSGAERMRITSGGNVTIGDTTTNNTGKFNYASPGVGSFNGVVELYHSTSNVNGSGFVNFYVNTSVIGSIGQSGTTGVTYNTTSDYRLKEDFKDYSGLDLVSQIKTYDYKWKSCEDRMYGVVAHELQEVIPYAVTGEKDAEQMQGVDYSKLVPVLVAAIQELTARLEILENK